MTRPSPIIVGTIAAILLLFGAYMGAYYVMLQSVYHFQEYETLRLTVIKETARPVYRIKGEAVESFLAPAHELDQLIRFTYWKERRYDTFDDPPSLIE